MLKQPHGRHVSPSLIPGSPPSNALVVCHLQLGKSKAQTQLLTVNFEVYQRHRVLLVCHEVDCLPLPSSHPQLDQRFQPRRVLMKFEIPFFDSWTNEQMQPLSLSLIHTSGMSICDEYILTPA